MSDKLKIFAENMKKKRMEQNKTLRGLAEATGLSATAISAYEKQTKVPSLENALTICEVLGCTLDEMCGVEIEIPSEEINTYSDAFKWIMLITEKLRGDARIWYNGRGHSESIITFTNTYVEKFFTDWERVRELYLNETIDEELYIAWKEKKLREYNISIIYQPIAPTAEAGKFEDLQSDDDLPF